MSFEEKSVEVCEKTETDDVNVQLEAIENIDCENPKNELTEKSAKRTNRHFITGLIVAIAGAGIFLLSVIASLILEGEVGLFDGIEFFFAMAWVSCSLMVIGLVALVKSMIKNYKARNNPFLNKKNIFITTLLMIVVCIGFVVWGVFNYIESVRWYPSEKVETAWLLNGKKSPYMSYNGIIKIDTNPYDSDGDSYLATMYMEDALEAIKDINSFLDVPFDVYYDRMLETTASDGIQAYENYLVTVVWKYHPDTGLEVSYTPMPDPFYRF